MVCKLPMSIYRMGLAGKNINALLGGLLFVHASVSAQPHVPGSFSTGWGVHIHAYDGREHKSEEHYENLCRVVMDEFGITNDSVSVNLIFVDSELKDKLNHNNPDRFYSPSWVGVFIKPTLIFMLGEEESDDTFLHEFMHSLHYRGLLFSNVDESDVHQLIHVNEGLLMGSRSYLEYLKTKQEPSTKQH